jgi:hypothetical protein
VQPKGQVWRVRNRLDDLLGSLAWHPLDRR